LLFAVASSAFLSYLRWRALFGRATKIFQSRYKLDPVGGSQPNRQDPRAALQSHIGQTCCAQGNFPIFPQSIIQKKKSSENAHGQWPPSQAQRPIGHVFDT
jgi:hypothetical protein